MNQRRSVRILFALLVSVGRGPFAQVRRASAAELGPCRPDYEKLCSEVPPGGGKILGCFQEHWEELKGECREHLRAVVKKEKRSAAGGKRSRIEQARRDCRSDTEKFCKNVEPGEGRLVRCLESKRDRLSAACKAALKKLDSGARLLKSIDTFAEACGADQRKLCRDLQPGGGAVIACLRKNEAQLSASCKALLPKADQLKGEIERAAKDAE